MSETDIEPEVLREEPTPYRATRMLPIPTRIVNRFVESNEPANAITSGVLIAALRAGLPMAELEALRQCLDLPMEKLAPILGISKATLHRRKAAGRLDLAESDRIVRYARLVGHAVTVLESLDGARRWLTAPQFGLGGAIPLEYAETEVGAREVEQLLGRIDYGVYA
jgi:putative toxin-antitoxin system antitoxin component (TIGR02293 family)